MTLILLIVDLMNWTFPSHPFSEWRPSWSNEGVSSIHIRSQFHLWVYVLMWGEDQLKWKKPVFKRFKTWKHFEQVFEHTPTHLILTEIWVPTTFLRFSTGKGFGVLNTCLNTIMVLMSLVSHFSFETLVWTSIHSLFLRRCPLKKHTQQVKITSR